MLVSREGEFHRPADAVLIEKNQDSAEFSMDGLPLNQTEDALRLLFSFSEAIERQRRALAGRNWSDLNESIKELQLAMQAMASFPGGSDGVRRQLSTAEAKDRQRADELIEKVISERKSSSELIRLHLQRLNALQAMTSIDPEISTYGESGAKQGTATRLSTWV